MTTILDIQILQNMLTFNNCLLLGFLLNRFKTITSRQYYKNYNSCVGT